MSETANRQDTRKERNGCDPRHHQSPHHRIPIEQAQENHLPIPSTRTDYTIPTSREAGHSKAQNHRFPILTQIIPSPATQPISPTTTSHIAKKKRRTKITPQQNACAHLSHPSYTNQRDGTQSHSPPHRLVKTRKEARHRITPNETPQNISPPDQDSNA